MLALYKKLFGKTYRLDSLSTYFYVKERCSRYVSDGRSYLLPGVDHIDTKRVNCISPDVVSVDSWNQHLAFVVVDEKSPNHCADFGGYLRF